MSGDNSLPPDTPKGPRSMTEEPKADSCGTSNNPGNFNYSGPAALTMDSVTSQSPGVYRTFPPQPQPRTLSVEKQSPSEIMHERQARGEAVFGWVEARKRDWEHIDAETIIIGHDIFNDLKVLDMDHERVVDTQSLVARE
ncbi:hypothetical protein BO71DRAFT_428845 [Aspergillus ellipticus CBS 707.79]|uniref:Exonuclease domain-containing protein n=1 Tax=Aspergillus ellipticus CBS 707.79 TaxID=1448320 RepID=A0A319DEI2_9EURO|nr:hypothetical protein BO71DRAFT_428845 [Aspergillus ellipticus CBS 707.79]